MSYPRTTLHFADGLRAIPPEQLVEQCADTFRQTEANIPVLICARNEASDLPATLAALALGTEAVHPVVVDNGSQDATADIASHVGATVIHEPNGSKTAAFQAGLTHINRLFGADIILSTDADTIPGTSWAASMTEAARSLPKEQGGLLFGLVAIRHGQSRQTDNLRTTLLNAKQVFNLVRNKAPGSRGNNMALRIDQSGRITDELLHAPDTFPGADRAQRDAVERAGGQLGVNFSGKSMVVSRGDRFHSLTQYAMVQARLITPSELYAEQEELIDQSHPSFQGQEQ